MEAKFKNILRILTRIVALPFFVVLHGLFALRGLIYITVMWLLYGGEYISYKKGDDKRMIGEIYDKLVKQHNEKPL